MKKETIEYRAGDKTCRGFYACNGEQSTPRPAVLIAHAWRGQEDVERQKAEALAKLGYVGFAADVYGDGIAVTTDAEAFELMKPLYFDRNLLRERITAAYETVRQLPQVDKTRIGIIGFCFGGLTAIQLLRSGADIRGAVSFHGVLADKMGDRHAKTFPIAKDIKGSLLLLHGHDDPMVSQEDIQNMQNEMTQAKVDWQMHIYGHTMHAFTNPQANNPAGGTLYNAKADHRSWISMKNFFEEVFA